MKKHLPKIKLFLAVLVLSLALSGCLPFSQEKAPCDQYAFGCGQKIRIDQ